jgi:hypothetical protein
VPEQDQDQPTPPERDSADGEPVEADIGASFRRMVSVLKDTVASREEITSWIGSWLPLFGALQSLAVTTAKLLWRAKEAASSAGDEPLLDDEAVADVEARFDELVEAFPQASEFFFGFEHVDSLVRETLTDADTRGAVAGFAVAVEARLNGLIGRLVQWGLDDDAGELSLERLEAFVRGLEGLLEQILNRWILPKLYGDLEE